MKGFYPKALSFLNNTFWYFLSQHLASHGCPAGAGHWEPWGCDIRTMSCLGRLEALRSLQSPATLAMFSPSSMKTSLVNKLSSLTNENLQNQRWHLRETVAELGIENQNSQKEREDLKDGYRWLQTSTSCLRTLVGDLHREVDDARDTLKYKENKIKQLELQNKNLD